MKKPPYWTVQVIPAHGGSVHTLRVRRRAVAAAAAAVAGAVFLLLAGLFGLLGERYTANEVARLRAENRRLSRGLTAVEERAEQLARSMDELAAREQRFRVLAGLPLLDPDVYAVGIGGPEVSGAENGLLATPPEVAAAAQALDPDLSQLLRRADLLATSLDEATDSVEARQEVFLARPSINPVASPQAWFSSGFTYSRLHPLLGYRRPHLGLDISAPPGSPVVAAARGRVAFAGRAAGYGRMVEIDHGYGYRTRYAHLAKVAAREGQLVDRGDVVGEVGRTGLATAPNLHYEILVNGRPVNPWEYLLDRDWSR